MTPINTHETCGQERVLHREGLPFLVAAHGWCAAAGAAGAYFPETFGELIVAAERAATERGLATETAPLHQPSWYQWLHSAVPAAEAAALCRHHLDEALRGAFGRDPLPRSPRWAAAREGDAGSWNLRWETETHEIILRKTPPDAGGFPRPGWALTVRSEEQGRSYRVVAAESAMRAAEERLELRAD